MLSLTDQENLKAIVEVLANEPDDQSLVEQFRRLKRSYPEAAWDVIFSDVKELPAEACADTGFRWYGTALIALKISGARVVRPGQSIGSSRLAATWGAVCLALTAAIEDELEDESDFPRDAEGFAIC